MNKEKISSQEIIDLVASKASVSKRASEEFLKIMISTIEETLLTGESVKIKNFGTFKLHWNEPRKSVNVQTGEDIIIAGYYKVNFTPDAVLKDQVNEPFAHLEPVKLDDEPENSVEPDYSENDYFKNDEVPEPLKIFTEQASEIKSLLSEIQALSANNKQDEIEEDIEDEDTYEDDLDDEINDEEIIVDGNVDIEITGEKEVEFKIDQENKVINVVDNPNESIEAELTVPESINIEPETYTEEVVSEDENEKTIDEVGLTLNSDEIIEPEAVNTVENEPNESSQQEVSNDEEFKEFLKAVDKVEHKKRTFYWILGILIFIVAVGFSMYKFYPPATGFVDTNLKSMQIPERYEATKNAISELFNSDQKAEVKKELTPAYETKVISKDTTELNTELIDEPVDSLQILFDTPRVYPEFIATVKMNYGSRLTLISQKYYGIPDFWVYIYEANSDRFTNPDQINTGSLIYVPKVDPRLIDASNPRCIEKARELHDLYVKNK